MFMNAVVSDGVLGEHGAARGQAAKRQLVGMRCA
jgi:hypothetical protein